jgi:hypothetical protein
MILRRSTALRLSFALAIAVVLVAPIANAYQSDDPAKDVSPYIADRQCSCHYPTPSENLSVTLKVPERTATGGTSTLVGVEVGIPAPVGEGIAFGLMLNATNMSGVRWDPSGFIGDGGFISAWVRINSTNPTIAFNVMEMRQTRSFNASFIPGNSNQTVEVTLIGMRTNNNQNVSGDFWTVATASVEVRRQKLLQLNVTLSNEELVSVSNLRVDFYVDDVYVGADTVDSLEGDSEANASVAWDATFAKDGWHDLRAVIDPMGNITELDRSNNEVKMRFWVGPVPEEADRSVLYLSVVVVVVVVAVVAGFWYYRQRIYKL